MTDQQPGTARPDDHRAGPPEGAAQPAGATGAAQAAGATGAAQQPGATGAAQRAGDDVGPDRVAAVAAVAVLDDPVRRTSSSPARPAPSAATRPRRRSG